LKLTRTYAIVHNLKSLEKVGAEIGQLRRLLRFDRVLMIVKEHVGFYQKGRMTKIERIMVLFKIMIVFGDISDILSFFLQLKVISKEGMAEKLKKNVGNIYFLECLGWLIYHVFEYSRSSDEESR
jgi:hypothetical protein